MLIDQTKTDSVTLTSAAAQAVKDLLIKRELPDYALRVFVTGGGCSGFNTEWRLRITYALPM